jgi:hypothetical protein
VRSSAPYVVLWHEVPPSDSPRSNWRECESHFDLLIADAPMLRTWALDRWPLESGMECRAVALPRHRRRYLTYEGPVSGNRGTVTRVETGQFQLLTDAPDMVVLQLQSETHTRRIQIQNYTERAAGWSYHRNKEIASRPPNPHPNH